MEDFRDVRHSSLSIIWQGRSEYEVLQKKDDPDTGSFCGPSVFSVRLQSKSHTGKNLQRGVRKDAVSYLFLQPGRACDPA